MIFGANQKLVFIGDSITDCGRRDQNKPFGSGYVNLTRAFLLARYPELGLAIENRGISGNTVRDLDKRWAKDVIAEQPDWLSVKIGINDVWRSVAGRAVEAVPADEYEATLRGLLQDTQAKTKARLILMEPYVIAPPVSGGAVAASGMTLEDVRRVYADLRQSNVSSGPQFEKSMMHFRVLIDQFCAIVRRLAGEFDAVLVPTQAAFDEAMRGQPPEFWAVDRVHPGAPGHAVISRAFLRAVGYGDV